jgi:alpha-beta hydrolase superfamily lysophospholipase
MVDALDLREHGRKLHCPYLLVGGELDELCTPEDMKDFMSALTCPKELWLYEGVFHPMGEVAADINAAIADWLRATLDNGLPQGHDRTIVVSERP